MPESLQATQAIDVRLSYAAAIAGVAIRIDREALAGMANCVMVLAEKHCIAADLEAAQAAQMALLRADGRAMQGKAWNFDGEGRAAIQTAMDLFEDMVANLGQGAVTDALLTVLERTAKGQVHRVELTQ
jgi:flagellar biosynthesis regulator FlbT